jgi:uncharacterized membrane protein
MIRSRRFIAIFIILSAIYISIAYATLSFRDSEEFISMSTLGSNMLAGDYYPNSNSNIKIGNELRWFVEIYNRMDKAEYIAIRVKILNSTDIAPNDNEHAPSPINHIYEIKKVIKSNETLTFPLTWRIDAIERDDRYVIIKKININNNDIEINTRSIDGNNFRIVLELWVYNPENNTFEFAWRANNNINSVWNQLWFNVQ